MKNKLICCILTLAMCFTFIPAFSTTAATTLTANTIGSVDGYDYELWKDSGNTSMTLTGGGTFTCEWNNIGNALFRTGKKFNSSQTYQQIGNIAVDYACEYNPSGNSYLCVYGWTKSPLVEYYIVDSWGSWRPPGSSSKGTITVDGGTYDVYETTRVEQPSIEGTATFQQYWSVRTTKRTSGVISVSKHFEAWEQMGMKMGNMYEVALTVEGYQSSGSANVYKHDLLVGGEIPDNPDIPDTPVEPDENGYFFHTTFEDGLDNWEGRGSASVAVDNSSANKGSNSAVVTSRADSWNGISRYLESNPFAPGSAFSFSAMAMYKTGGASETFKLTLQYTDSSGEDNYVEIASATAVANQWVQLSNTSFEIPNDASNVILYLETLDSTIDFYTDELIGAQEGVVIEDTGDDPVITYPKGDVNHSGKVDSQDVKDLNTFIHGKTVIIYNDTADLNDDGKISVIDLSILKRTVLYSGANTIMPIEPPVILSEGQWDNQADISWIDTSKPMVAFTFDDGPVGVASSDTSIRIQNALSSNSAHATFFYWGERIITANQSEITRAQSLGFEIGNHTYTHSYLTNLSADGIKNEIDKTAEILKSLTGINSFLVRPPYLAVNQTVEQNVSVPLINCSVDSQDWNNASSEQIINTITSKMSDGSLRNSIVLMHENYNSTAAAIEYLAPYMKEQGWQIVSVSELFKANGKDMWAGKVYNSCS